MVVGAGVRRARGYKAGGDDDTDVDCGNRTAPCSGGEAVSLKAGLCVSFLGETD